MCGFKTEQNKRIGQLAVLIESTNSSNTCAVIAQDKDAIADSTVIKNLRSIAHTLDGTKNGLGAEEMTSTSRQNFFVFTKISYLQPFREFMGGTRKTRYIERTTTNERTTTTTNYMDDHNTPSGYSESSG